MNLLSTLAVAGKDNLGRGTSLEDLLGQTSHGLCACGTGGAGSTADGAGYVGWVCDTLCGHLATAEGALQSRLEGRADSAAHVPCLGSATSEDVGDCLADAVGHIVLCAAAGGGLRNCCWSSESADCEASEDEGLHLELYD